MEKKTLQDYEVDIPKVADLLQDDAALSDFFLRI